MPIPNYETLMLPMLRIVAKLPEARIQDLTVELANEFNLSEAEREALIPSEKTSVIRSRSGWARSYLVQAGLLESVRRSVVRITQRGRDTLKSNPHKIDNLFLAQFAEFRDFRNRSRTVPVASSTSLKNEPINQKITSDAGTPDDLISEAVGIIEAKVRDELKERLLAATPAFFERAVVDLLLAMGYGNAAEDAGETLGKTGDGGVDGIIREDSLGLDLIYVQAKRYRDQSISPDQIRSFSGALNDKGARKGVFITTSRFTSEAEAFAKRQQNQRIVLIDGERLTQLLLRHDVGVRPDRTITLKRVDMDYFDPEETL